MHGKDRQENLICMITTQDGPETGKRQECRVMITKKGSWEVSENSFVRVNVQKCVCVRVCVSKFVTDPILQIGGATGSLSKAKQHLLKFTIRLFLWEC